MTLLMVLSVLGVVVLFAALAAFLVFITEELETIGGPATRFKKPVNYLSHIRMGVRAIEMQTGGLAPQVTKLNAGLTAVRDGLVAIDQNLAAVIAGVSRQKRS